MAGAAGERSQTLAAMHLAALRRPSHRGTRRPRAFATPWRAVLAGCAAAAMATTAWSTPADDAFAAQVLDAVNQARQQAQLPALREAPALAALAAEHSALMARQGRLSHDGFQQRFAQAQRQTCVENLAAGYRQAAPLLAGWRASPGHQQNLLDARVQDVGVASVAGHVTWLACSAATAPGR